MTSVEIPLQTLLLGEGVRTVLSPGLVADWKEGSYRIEVLKGEQLVYSKPFRLIYFYPFQVPPFRVSLLIGRHLGAEVVGLGVFVFGFLCPFGRGWCVAAARASRAG